MQYSSGCACAGVTHRTACCYRARRYPSSLVPSQSLLPPPSSPLPSRPLQLRSQPPPSLFLSFAGVLRPSSAITSVTKLRGDLVLGPLLVHVLGIYGIRSRLRDTVPSPSLRFVATSQIRFVPPSDYFSAVSHSTDRPLFLFLFLYELARD